MNACEAALKDYRTSPGAEYVANLGLKLHEARLTAQMVTFMFEKAALLHDFYPSLAQMMKIADEYDVRTKFGPPRLKIAAKPRGVPHPWPPLVRLYIAARAEGQPLEGFKFFKKNWRLRENEAEELVAFWRAGDLRNKRALEIIASKCVSRRDREEEGRELAE